MADHDVHRIVGTSRALAAVLDQADAVANTEATVLILGETGVGKELIARRIHDRSAHQAGPLVTVNCASIPHDLFESEMFGHVRGAFTGANRDRVGRIESAAGGTLLLDEVGEIPAALQAKLLRVLQERRFERIGEDRSRHADVRFIAATNRPLEQEVSSGRFRRDLYYRLCVFPIEIPPLRSRPEDILPLARHFLTRLAVAHRVPCPKLSRAQIQRLRAYDWPGNVRELVNVLERAVILANGKELDLESALPKSALYFAAHIPPVAEQGAARGFFTETEFEQLAQQNLIAALEASHWKISGRAGAATLLGLNPSTLTSRLKAMDIRAPEPDSLYVRLGAHRGISTLARELFGRVLSDPQLSRFWANRSNIGVLREVHLLTAYLGAASGGPIRYNGRDMRSAHRDLAIDDSDWERFQQHLDATLQALRIDAAAGDEVVEFAASLKADIVRH